MGWGHCVLLLPGWRGLSRITCPCGTSHQVGRRRYTPACLMLLCTVLLCRRIGNGIVALHLGAWECIQLPVGCVVRLLELDDPSVGAISRVVLFLCGAESAGVVRWLDRFGRVGRR
jgi:hypothetical protein